MANKLSRRNHDFWRNCQEIYRTGIKTNAGRVDVNHMEWRKSIPTSLIGTVIRLSLKSQSFNNSTSASQFRNQSCNKLRQRRNQLPATIRFHRDRRTQQITRPLLIKINNDWLTDTALWSTQWTKQRNETHTQTERETERETERKKRSDLPNSRYFQNIPLDRHVKFRQIHADLDDIRPFDLVNMTQVHLTRKHR